MREPLRVIAVAFEDGVWVRLQGPLSGAWYGPWRLCADATWASGNKVGGGGDDADVRSRPTPAESQRSDRPES